MASQRQIACKWKPNASRFLILIGLVMSSSLLLQLAATSALANLGRYRSQEPIDFDFSAAVATAAAATGAGAGDETFRNEGAFGSPVRYPEGAWSYDRQLQQLQQDQQQQQLQQLPLARNQYVVDDQLQQQQQQQQQPDLATIYFAPASQAPQTLAAESKLPTLAESLARLEAINKLKQSLSLQFPNYDYQTQVAASEPAPLVPQLWSSRQQDAKPLSLPSTFYSLDQAEDNNLAPSTLLTGQTSNPKRASNDGASLSTVTDDEVSEPEPVGGDNNTKTIVTTLLEDEEPQQQPDANVTVVAAAAATSPAKASLEGRDRTGVAVGPKIVDGKQQDELGYNYLASMFGWLRDKVAGGGAWLANNLAENNKRLNDTAGHKLVANNATNATTTTSGSSSSSSSEQVSPSKQALGAANEKQTSASSPANSNATLPAEPETKERDETNDKTSEPVAASKADNNNNNMNNNNSNNKASNNKRDPFERVLVGEQQLGPQRVSLLRQSTLALPLGEPGDSDERLAPAGSLFGRYFAGPYNQFRASQEESDESNLGQKPTSLLQKAYLSSVGRYSQPPHGVASGDLYSAGYPAGFGLVARHPDDHISYFHAASQRNDIYFLIMVGTFCVMAMAVVLAAGLFAYRVQQNRKTTSDGQDYPTYGVVGPNNMSAKLGALGANIGHGNANLVGSYLASHGGNLGGSQAGASGKGSIGKQSQCHSPELYSPNDSGIGGPSSKKSSNNDMSPAGVAAAAAAASAAGANRSNFLAGNQNAARMYHYQHQKQQMIISDRTSTGRHTSASDLDSEEENEEGNYTVYECPGLASAHEMEIKNPLFNDDRSP